MKEIRFKIVAIEDAKGNINKDSKRVTAHVMGPKFCSVSIYIKKESDMTIGKIRERLLEAYSDSYIVEVGDII